MKADGKDSHFPHDAGVVPPQRLDLDACWRRVLRNITSGDKERTLHRPTKSQNPVYVYMNPSAWRRLVEEKGAWHAVELMLSLGFVPAPEGVASLSGWIEGEAVYTSAQIDDSDGTNDAADFSTLLRAIAEEKPDGVRGVRFQVMQDQENPPSAPVRYVLSHAPAVTGTQSDSPAPSERETRGGGVPARRIGPSHKQETTVGAMLTIAPVESVSGGACSAETSELEIPPVQRVHLQAQLKELKRQVRFLKLRTHNANDCPVGSEVSSVSQPSSPGRTTQPSPQEPRIAIHQDFPVVASTHCQTPVWLSVSYLDADCAPYVVSLGSGSGRMLLACTTVDHRFVFFVAPPRGRGRRRVDLLCTRDGTLRPYAGPVWLEYRAQDPPNTLTHHAVNQLLQEIPLPTSTLSVDAANPSEAELAKSESAFDDDNTGCDTDTAATVSELGFESEPRLPLTKEMLRFIQNGPLPSSLPRRRRVGTSAVGSTSTVGGVEVDREGMEDGEEDDGDAAGATHELQASQTWRGSTRATVLGSTVLSTGHPPSWVHGTHSCRSDEEATPSALPCTELSSSSMTSLPSHESFASTAAGIMARRGWVRT